MAPTGLANDGQDTRAIQAAVAALTVKAKLAGLWVDKAENKANNVVYHIADRPMTMDEWEQKWCSAGDNVSN